MSLKFKIISVMAVLGFIAAVIFAVYTYRQATGQATSDARKTADMLIGRAVQMFIVSTKRFHEDFQRTVDKPAERKRIMADWNRTIFAVDQAVIHDHGADQPRVRLIGDKSLFNYQPLGEENTSIRIPFETEAGKALLQGRSRYEKIENDILRVSIPLPSQAHPGCAECHFTEVEGKDGDAKGLDMSRNIILGALNAYVPLAAPMARAKEQAFWSLALVFLVIAVLIAAIGVYVARYVVRPINGIVDQLDQGGESLVGSTEEISRAAQSLAEGTGQQAAAIEQTSASLEEMASMTKSSAESAQQADALMAKTNQVTHRAEESMDSVTRSMDQIAESGAEISKIVKSIDEIAFQTNLLALNAAVEAARAGEAGAGFAVVADEVRNLAMRAADAAKSTQSLIEDTVKRIGDGSELVSLTRDQFQEVGQATGRIAGLISEIASASGEQAQGIDQIRGAISQMDQVVQQNASNAEESAAAAAGMDAQARTMQESVSDLYRLISGDVIDQDRTAEPSDRERSTSTDLIGIEDQRGRFGRKS